MGTTPRSTIGLDMFTTVKVDYLRGRMHTVICDIGLYMFLMLILTDSTTLLSTCSNGISS